ncbi:hypothetical protein VP01_636g3 [Puccinia sorghi]|uniref:Uncharacterized protein n=1 Tax=Puccinia sorghi TaxID=27349 RepID=A0A0L6UG05_9BASI|nr:hypothetical protein VP01_636g3 [Puccinia sorghi]
MEGTGCIQPGSGSGKGIWLVDWRCSETSGRVSGVYFMLLKSKSSLILGGQFGAQERDRPSIFLESEDNQCLSSVGKLVRRGQFGASNLDYKHEEGCLDSDEGTVVDKSYATKILESSQNASFLLSERSHSTKKPKKQPYSIELQTFFHSGNVIDEDPPCINLVELIEYLYAMSPHQSNLKNKNKISGRMAGIGLRGGYEQGTTAGNCKGCLGQKASTKPPLSQSICCPKVLLLLKGFLKSKQGALQRFGIPSWSDESWESYNKTLLQWTKLFYLWDLPLHQPINWNSNPSPLIHPLYWKSNELAHHTLAPPPELKITRSSHFGCSFHLIHMLVSRAVMLKNMSSEERKMKKMKKKMKRDQRGNVLKKDDFFLF